MATSKSEIEQALNDPHGVYGTPDRVLADPELSREQKCEILTRWEQDARELSVAEEEGMAGGEQSMLHRVLDALESLGDPDGKTEDDKAAATTKHGGGHS